MYTLSNGLLNEGGTTSYLFVLKLGNQAQKISVINQLENNSETIVFQNGKPVFMQFSQPDGSEWIFYFVGENAYFRDGNMFNNGSSSF